MSWDYASEALTELIDNMRYEDRRETPVTYKFAPDYSPLPRMVTSSEVVHYTDKPGHFNTPERIVNESVYEILGGRFITGPTGQQLEINRVAIRYINNSPGKRCMRDEPLVYLFNAETPKFEYEYSTRKGQFRDVGGILADRESGRE